MYIIIVQKKMKLNAYKLFARILDRPKCTYIHELWGGAVQVAEGSTLSSPANLNLPAYTLTSVIISTHSLDNKNK